MTNYVVREDGIYHKAVCQYLTDGIQRFCPKCGGGTAAPADIKEPYDEAQRRADKDAAAKRENKAFMNNQRSTFTPQLPPHWEHFIGVVPIDLDDDIFTWNEDIFSARWTDPMTAKEWNIWLDGGKGVSAWQCSLVIVAPLNADGVLEHDHDWIMRDFLNTPEQVQAWIDRAVAIAARWDAKQETKQ